MVSVDNSLETFNRKTFNFKLNIFKHYTYFMTDTNYFFVKNIHRYYS